jgi:hypothetical protein
MGMVGVIGFLLQRLGLIIVAITRVLSAGGLALSHVVPLLLTLPQAGFEGQLSSVFPRLSLFGELEYLRRSPPVHYRVVETGSFFNH